MTARQLYASLEIYLPPPVMKSASNDDSMINLSGKKSHLDEPTLLFRENKLRINTRVLTTWLEWNLNLCSWSHL